MLNAQALWSRPVRDRFQNIHFLDNRFLVASIFAKVEILCKVNLEVVYDVKWEDVYVHHDGPVAVVYSKPVMIEGSIDTFTQKTGFLEGFWVIGAINGLGFCSDMFPAGWSIPQFATPMSSDLEMDCDLDDQHKLARDLILLFTEKDWDQELVNRAREETTEEFINKLLNAGKN